MRELDKQQLQDTLLAYLKTYYGDTLYRGFIEDKLEIEEITDKDILFDVGNVRLIGKTYGQKFREAFDDTLKELVPA